MSTNNTHTTGGHVAHHFRDAEHQFESAKQGIWLFMVTEILMFGGLFVGYAIFHSIYPQMFSEGASHLDWRLGFVNTLVLIVSSYTMAMSIHHLQKNEKDQAVTKLWITVACGLVFMVIKAFEYSSKFQHGLFPGHLLDVAKAHAEYANLGMYYGFYFCMTGLHGLHVLIGMGLIIWLAIRAKRGDFSSEYFTPVEGVGIFWHIVDLIWIFLFPLLYLVG